MQCEDIYLFIKQIYTAADCDSEWLTDNKHIINNNTANCKNENIYESCKQLHIYQENMKCPKKAFSFLQKM